MCLWSVRKFSQIQVPYRIGSSPEHRDNSLTVFRQNCQPIYQILSSPSQFLMIIFKLSSLGRRKKKSGHEHYSCPATESSYWKSASSLVEEMKPAEGMKYSAGPKKIIILLISQPEILVLLTMWQFLFRDFNIITITTLLFLFPNRQFHA